MLPECKPTRAHTHPISTLPILDIGLLARAQSATSLQKDWPKSLLKTPMTNTNINTVPTFGQKKTYVRSKMCLKELLLTLWRNQYNPLCVTPWTRVMKDICKKVMTRTKGLIKCSSTRQIQTPTQSNSILESPWTVIPSWVLKCPTHREDPTISLAKKILFLLNWKSFLFKNPDLRINLRRKLRSKAASSLPKAIIKGTQAHMDTWTNRSQNRPLEKVFFSGRINRIILAFSSKKNKARHKAKPRKILFPPFSLCYSKMILRSTPAFLLNNLSLSHKRKWQQGLISAIKVKAYLKTKTNKNRPLL